MLAVRNARAGMNCAEEEPCSRSKRRTRPLRPLDGNSDASELIGGRAATRMEDWSTYRRQRLDEDEEAIG